MQVNDGEPDNQQFDPSERNNMLLEYRYRGVSGFSSEYRLLRTSMDPVDIHPLDPMEIYLISRTLEEVQKVSVIFIDAL
jgi:hypothetical protein